MSAAAIPSDASSAPASTAAAPLPLLERLADRLNPIFIKETRQALKSKQFLAAFFLMLLAAWLTATLGLLLDGGGAEFNKTGPKLFLFFFHILCAATYVVVPFGTFRSLLAERDQFTYEVLAITTLKPRQIVWGKLCTSILQIFIYYSAITPFIAFTYQLRGISVLTIAYVLTNALLSSVALSLVSLTISTFARQRAVQVLMTLAVIIGLLVAYFTSLALTLSTTHGTSTMATGPMFDEAGFWIEKGVMLAYYVVYFVLLMELAIGQLTFEADNRSTPVRLTVAFLFWMSVGWLALGTWLHPLGQRDNLDLFLAWGTVHWLTLGLFAVTEADELSRRTQRSLKQRGLLLRTLATLLAPIWPGGARGLSFVLGHVVAMSIAAMCLVAFLPGRSPATTGWHDVKFQYVLCVYGLFCVIYLGGACALARWMRHFSPDFRPAHARVFAVLIAAIVAVVPKLAQLLVPDLEHFPLMMAADPLTAASYLNTSHIEYEQSFMLICLALIAALALLINVQAMIRGFSEVAFMKRPASDPHSPILESRS